MKKMFALHLPVVLILTIPFSPLIAAEAVPLPPKKSFHLILLTGQSNMAGRGKVEAEDQVPHPRVLMLNREGEWVPAVDPVHYDKGAAGVGLGSTFARRLADCDPTITVGLIPAACGGSGLDVWRPGEYFDQTKSHPYDDAVARTRLALRRGTLKAILFHQGEADCSEAASHLYYERLIHLMQELRREFDAPDVPVVIGQLGQFPSRPWSEARLRVDAAHRRAAETLPHCGFVSSDGLTCNPDNIHFDAASLREFGSRYYKVYRDLAGQPNLPAVGR